jgi:DNA-binding NtrC family response regulator
MASGTGRDAREAETAAGADNREALYAVSFRLDVVKGPDAGRSFIVSFAEPSRTLIGRSSICDIQLNDPHVSRRHASVEVRPGFLRWANLSGTGGTYVGEVSINDANLWGGEVVRIGSTELRVTLVDADPTIRVPAVDGFGNVLGASEEMRRLYPMLAKLADSDLPCIIEGETGTGKEVVAESLHERGPRAAGPFVILDCTSVPADAFEAALFGSAGDDGGAGAIEQADGGTLLLDGIEELDPALQARLLRAIETGTVQRVGAREPTKVNVRFLAATRRDLDEEVQAGRFREDLFYRLAVTRIELPPLRSRAGDVELLTREFWKRLGGAPAGPPPAMLERFRHQAWPGNVRELRNAVARHLALGDDTPESSKASAAPADFIEHVLTMDLMLPRARELVIADFERRYVERVLATHGGHVGRAAAASGLARRYFQELRAKRVPR